MKRVLSVFLSLLFLVSLISFVSCANLRPEAHEGAGLKSVTAELEIGNYYLPENERTPVSITIDLPSGWRIEKGIAEGAAWYPDNELKANSLIGRYGDAERAFTILDASGSAVGAMICSAMIWTDELKEEFGYDAMTPEEKLDKEAEIAFSEFKGSLSSLVLSGEGSRTVSKGDGVVRTVCETAVTSTADANGVKRKFSCPAAAAFGSALGIGCFAEFSPEAVSDEQLVSIAESIVFSASAH